MEFTLDCILGKWLRSCIWNGTINHFRKLSPSLFAKVQVVLLDKVQSTIQYFISTFVSKVWENQQMLITRWIFSNIFPMIDLFLSKFHNIFLHALVTISFQIKMIQRQHESQVIRTLWKKPKFGTSVRQKSCGSKVGLKFDPFLICLRENGRFLKSYT